jgi:RNA polymerase sigma-70 factor (ECF subfamily)
VDDAALLRSTCQGDESAFAQLFERYQRRLHQYAGRMCGSAAADDVVQETFLAVLKARQFDSSKGTVAAYLFGIARHFIIRHLKKDGIVLEPGSLGEPEVTDTAGRPHEAFARAETIAVVRAAVASLPPVYREVIELCELQEMDYAMVAEVIQRPIGTVRSRLHRARALLATSLAGMPCQPRARA